MKTYDLPAYTIADLVKTRQISAVEVLEQTLERVRSVDGRTGQVDAAQAQSEEDLNTVHAFTLLTEEHAPCLVVRPSQFLPSWDSEGRSAILPIAPLPVH